MDKTVRLWSVTRLTRVAAFSTRQIVLGVWAVAFSPDGRSLAVANVDGVTQVLSIPGSVATRSFHDQGDAVAFTPDGRTLITVGFDATIRLWDTATRALTAAISTDGRGIEALSYSGSLGMIATADGSATRVWRTDPTAVAADACATLKAPLTPAEWNTYLPEYPFSPVC